jgi:hypothetical protein
MEALLSSLILVELEQEDGTQVQWDYLRRW